MSNFQFMYRVKAISFVFYPLLVLFFGAIIFNEHKLSISVMVVAATLTGIVLHMLWKGLPSEYHITATNFIVYGWKVANPFSLKSILFSCCWDDVTEYYSFVFVKQITVVEDNKKKEIGIAPFFVEDYEGLHNKII